MPSIINSNYKCLKTLAKTSFKVVKLCLDNQENTVVLKVFRKKAIPSEIVWN